MEYRYWLNGMRVVSMVDILVYRDCGWGFEVGDGINIGIEIDKICCCCCQQSSPELTQSLVCMELSEARSTDEDDGSMRCEKAVWPEFLT
jgi:hypothetical protein